MSSEGKVMRKGTGHPASYIMFKIGEDQTPQNPMSISAIGLPLSFV